jgi:curved DNA-binding protein CbpA
MGLDPRATPTAKEIRDAWRQRVAQVHPDRETGDQGAFVRLSAAYQRLKTMFGEP